MIVVKVNVPEFCPLAIVIRGGTGRTDWFDEASGIVRPVEGAFAVSVTLQLPAAPPVIWPGVMTTVSSWIGRTVRVAVFVEFVQFAVIVATV